MALTGNANYDFRPANEEAIEIVDAVQIFAHSYTAIVHRNDTVATERGRLRPFTSANFRIPLGLSQDKDLGNLAPTSPQATGPIKAKISFTRGDARTLPVTGLAGTFADVGREVYATDDGTFTLTRAAKAALIGFVVQPRSSAQAVVALISGLDQLLLQKAVTRYTMFLGTVSGVIPVSAIVKNDITMPHHGQIESVFGIVVEPFQGAASATLFNLQVGTTDLTGGVVSVSGADAAGAKKSGTAVTANNFFHEDDLVDIEAVVGATPPTQGLVEFWAVVRTELGN